MKRQILTVLCVALAGLIFILTVLYNRPLFALIGAFFDWLPLPAGWMKAERHSTFPKLHVVVTLVAYAIFVAWLATGTAALGLAFLEVWWVAVILGVLMGY